MPTIEVLESEKQAAVSKIFFLQMKSKSTLITARHCPRRSSAFIQMMSDVNEADATSKLLRELVVKPLNDEIATHKQANRNGARQESKLKIWLRMTFRSVWC